MHVIRKCVEFEYARNLKKIAEIGEKKIREI